MHLNSDISSHGFSASISTVPIRSASARLFARSFISSVSETPLSDTRSFPAFLISSVTMSDSFFVVSRFTSKVLRLRLLIPIILTSSASILFISSSSCTSHNTSSPRLYASSYNSLNLSSSNIAAISSMASAPITLASYT